VAQLLPMNGQLFHRCQPTLDPSRDHPVHRPTHAALGTRPARPHNAPRFQPLPKPHPAR
jgi:hypothetical protein